MVKPKKKAVKKKVPQKSKLRALQKGLVDLKSIPPQGKKDVTIYSGPGAEINNYLRRRQTGSIHHGTGQLSALDAAKKLEPLFRKLNRRVTVYRGLGYEVLKKIRRLKVGDTFKDQAFLSTSLSRSVAARFGDHFMKISLKKGTSVIHVDGLRGKFWEHELVLPRHTKLKFLRTKKTQTRNIFEFQLIG